MADMLHGYAWQVEYKYRSEQNFVTTDTSYLAEVLTHDIRNLPDWKFSVRLVSFRGETALNIMTTVYDLLSSIPDSLERLLRNEKNALFYDGKDRK